MEFLKTGFQTYSFIIMYPLLQSLCNFRPFYLCNIYSKQNNGILAMLFNLFNIYGLHVNLPGSQLRSAGYRKSFCTPFLLMALERGEKDLAPEPPVKSDRDNS